MRKTKKLLLSALLSLVGLMCPQSARAQFIGDVGLQTVNPLLANNATCTGTAQSFTVQNIGQIGHQATAISTAASFTMEIDASDASSATYRISNPQISFTNGTPVSYIVQANGYYPLVKVVVTCTAAATFTLTYAGAQTGFNSVIGPPGGTPINPGGTVAANVQGVVSQNQGATLVLPLIDGAVQQATNGQFLTTGIDNFSVGSTSIPIGTTSTVQIGTAPTPTKSGELGIVFDAYPADTVSTLPVAPWTCAPSFPGSCNLGAPRLSASFIANIPAGQVYRRSYTNSTVDTVGLAVFVNVQSPTASIRQDAASGPPTASFGSNTLAGSLVLVGIRCATTTVCVPSSVTDTQGNTYAPISNVQASGQTPSALYVYGATTLTTAAADSVTVNLASGTVLGIALLEVQGVTTSLLNEPAISVEADSLGRQIIAQDAQAPNQFVCNVTISTATTTQCETAATTINGIAVRAYVTDIQVNTTTTGTASAVQLVTGTGTNCGTGVANLSAITYSTVTAAAPALASFLGMRTPLIAPLQTAVCVKQTGTPGTATVEVHGFFAP